MSLINMKNDCFVNSFMQSINKLIDFHYLHNLNNDNSFSQEIKNILYHNQNSLPNLKRIIGRRFNDRSQQCIHEF